MQERLFYRQDQNFGETDVMKEVDERHDIPKSSERIRRRFLKKRNRLNKEVMKKGIDVVAQIEERFAEAEVKEGISRADISGNWPQAHFLN
jgi:hypothetical protein